MFKIFSKNNPQKHSLLTIFFGGRDKDDVHDIGDRVEVYREDGRWAGWGKVVRKFDDEKYTTILCGGKSADLGESYREIEIRG